MDAPKKVVLKRRRSESPPDTLIVEKKTKRDDGGQDSVRPTTYIRHRASKASLKGVDPRKVDTGSSKQHQRQANERREFYLSRPVAAPAAINSKKRKQNDDLVATVVESKRSKHQKDQPPALSKDPEIEYEPLSRPLKRPGRGTANAVAKQTDLNFPPKPQKTFIGTQIAMEQQRLDALAEEMHRFALEEMAKTPKPEVKTRPKFSGAQARARHQARSSEPATPGPASKSSRPRSAEDEMDTSLDGEYVFDTYILAPQPPEHEHEHEHEHTLQGNAQVVALSTHHNDHGNVGYLVITADEEKLWEDFIERDELEDSEPEDEDDENAEAYHGADYPSDELASDDEYDRGAYGYRQHHGSDDEQWDDHTWSDEEEKRVGNPFDAKGKVSARFAKYLDRGVGGGEESSGNEA